ncbi:MAG: ParB/RepB/Spo0J family partition protein [Ethanoligenens sp.]
MKSIAKDVEFESLDSIFKPREVVESEQIINIPLTELHPFKGHPFQVRDDEAMQDLTESIQKAGVYTPAIVRPREEGGYELIAGHRRAHACELAGKDILPVVVRNLDDDAATILMCDTNLQQRDSILPSERAFAYKLKLDAMKRQAGRPSKGNLSPMGTSLKGQRSDQILADQVGESRNQVQRYIRLTELVPPLLELVDSGKVAFRPAVELSYLKKEEQTTLLDLMDAEQSTPSLAQAQRLKQFSQKGMLSENSMLAIMTEEKNEPEKVTFTGERLKKYFPRDTTPKQMEDTIIKLLEQWKTRQHNQER